ncbi:unnamed protein product [Discosporangium mesarthrocarpum]
MATRGVFQLRTLTVQYCDYGGSSRGARDFIRNRIVDFARDHPHAEVVTELKRGRHPKLVGGYVTGNTKVVEVKNRNPDEIMDFAFMLRNSSGRKMTKFKRPVESRNPSIQGVWSNEFPLHTIPFDVKHQG